MLDVITTQGLKVKINPNHILQQVEVQQGTHTWYELHLTNGSKFKISHPLREIKFTTRQVAAVHHNVDYSNVLLSPKTSLRAEQCPSVHSGVWSGIKPSIEAFEEKYQGQMLWGHKTAPEILIFDKSKKQIIKDVDLTKIAKRR